MRVFPNKFGDLRLQEGSYGKDMKGRWWYRGLVNKSTVGLRSEDVREHEDGTITLSGYLLHGVWATTSAAIIGRINGF